jgi:N-methylhydantoinase B/oxoprolinase/acetone carboxylase alpha subunit
VDPPPVCRVDTGMTNARNTPIETLEQAFPLRVLRQRLRRGSGGAGVLGVARGSSGICGCSPM